MVENEESVSVVETGWLIELFAENGNSEYKALGIVATLRTWVPFDDALRFAREQDAQAYIEMLYPYSHDKDSICKAIEHSWG